ncbi:MAG: tetratricopeptide repeat protein, partial [Alphaproteobacteria bacterium]|nr:tetratricopeptide repeat protein [Alphaproteobacteria bacterium]
MPRLHKIGSHPADPVGDIVFIHGIAGHHKETWTHKNGAFWPEWVARDWPEVRVWSLEHEASPLEMIGGDIDSDELAASCLECLRYEGIGSNSVAFVGHSLGGILVKKILLRCCGTFSNSRPELADHTKAIVFFGVPHTGSKVAGALSSIGAQIASFGLGIPLAPIVAGLRKGSRDLIRLRRDFVHLTSERSGRLQGVWSKSYYETRSMPRLFGIEIVDRESADAGIDGDILPIARNHIELCKFGSKDEFAYRPFVGDLRAAFQKSRRLFEHITQLEKPLHDAIRAAILKGHRIGGGEELKAVFDAGESLIRLAGSEQPPENALEAARRLAAGDPIAAEKIFEKIATEKASIGHAALKEAAEAARHLGALLMLRDTRKALAAYRRAAEYDASDFWTWIFAGRLEMQGGNLSRAVEAFGRAQLLAEGAQSQRDQMVAIGSTGDVRVRQGNLPGALAAFEEAKKIADRLAATDPANTEWQRDLSVSWIKIGDVRVRQGNLPGALSAFEEGKKIADRLAATDTANTGWQRDLSVNWIKIGDVRVRQGNLPGALAAFKEGKKIRARLAATDPVNTGWQRDLSVSWERIGDVRAGQGNLPGALAAFEEVKNIRDRLAATDPANTGWQRDVSVSWNKIGDVRAGQGDLPGALAAFEEVKNIRDRLAATDPANTE